MTVFHEAQQMQDASPRRRTEPTMNKLTRLALLAPLALTASLVGCIGATDAEEDTSSVAQASSTAITGTWTGFPAAQLTTFQHVTCALGPGSWVGFDLGYMGNQSSLFLNMTASANGVPFTSSMLAPNNRPFASGTTTRIMAPPNKGWFDVALATTAQGQLSLGITDGSLAGVGSFTCPTTLVYVVSAPVASAVTISGDPYAGEQLQGSYTFSDSPGVGESGSTYQWNTVVNGVSTAISGATSATYTPTSAQINSDLEFCVTPADGFSSGVEVCSSAVTVPGIVWYSGAGATGTSAAETITDGTCVSMSSIGMANNTLAVDLYGLASNQTTLVMYKTSNCTGTSYTRYAGAGTVHNISLTTVGIGTKTLSYKVSW
jgi:hypothetical protein